MSRVATYHRTNPLLHYLLLLFASVGCYLLYLQFVVPKIEVTSTIKRPASNLDEYHQVELDNQHHKWFKDGDWELLPCSVLQTAHGKILFDDFKAEDTKTWLVYPFTMVLEREQEPGATKPAAPIVMRCETGARLHFSKPVTGTAGGSSFQLQAAQLEGMVELYRRSNAHSLNEDLRIETSNIQINQDQIFTIDDVVFRFGNNSGVGRNLTMRLNHDVSPNSLSNDISRINGITNLRLGLLSSMMLKPTRKPTNDPSDRLLSHDQSPIEIKSAGPFEFDFTSNLARFVDQVQIRKMDVNGDTLNCDELILQFAADNSKNVIQLDAATDQEFDLENIIAIGSPAILTARSQNAKISAKTLDYNLKTQLIKATDDRQVEILKDNDRFVSKSIEYLLTDDRRLGNLTASGAGQLTRQTEKGTFTANWANSLTIRPISQQQHLIQIDGRAQLQLDRQTQMNAELIQLNVWEIPVFDHNNRFVRWEYQPQKLEAKNRVHISSEKLIADSNYLNAVWPAKLQPFKRRQDPVSQVHQPPMQTYAHLTRTKRPNYQQEQAIPVMAQGNAINVSVNDKNGKTEITDLQISGNVIVKQPKATDPKVAEFEIHGDLLKMIPQGEKLFEVQVMSQTENPASIHSEKLVLHGQQVFLNQIKNSVWVSGHGNVKMNSLSQAGSSESNNEIDVNFSGGMIFDGKRIYFERDIRAKIKQQATGTTTITNASGTALSLTLDRRIDLKKLDNSNGEQPEIIDMAFRQHLPADKAKFKSVDKNFSQTQPVFIENYKQDSTGKIIEKLALQSPFAKMDRRTNELVARGPGSIQIYRPGSNGRGAVGFGFVGNANSTDALTYIHTNFDDKLVANSKSSEFKILGNLRSVYASVSDFQKRFNPDRLDQLPQGAVRLNCDRIDLIRSNNSLSPKPLSEFVASGNAHIHSETVDSKADRISYRDDTDELTVKGDNGKNIQVNFRRDSNSQWNRVSGPKIVYNVKDKSANGNISNASSVFERLP